MKDPSEIFRDAVKAIIAGMHTSLPAIIVSFDASSNKATVQPALNKAYLSGEIPLPLLENVPVLFPKNITFPVEQGDYVLLVFAERSLDLWLSQGGQVTPNDPRKYHLSDAIAIPGLKAFNDDFSENDGTSFKIIYAGSEVRIESNGNIIIETGNKVAIGTQAVELLQQISDTLAGIEAITITIPSGSSAGIYPINNIATFTAIRNNIESIKGLIT